MGYANSSHMYYRHLMESLNGTFTITVNPIFGNPTMMVSISNKPVYPNYFNYSSYNYIEVSPYS